MTQTDQAPPQESQNNPWWVAPLAVVAIIAIAAAAFLLGVLLSEDNDSTTVAPTPSSQPSDTPTSTPAGPNSSHPRPFEIPAGTSATVLKGWCVEGDIRVNGVAQYDDDDTTGLVTCMTQDAVVEAQWGAYASDADANAQEKDMFRPGACGRAEGCHQVILKYAP